MGKSMDMIEMYGVQEIHADGADSHFIIGSTFKFTYFTLQKVPGMVGLQRVAVLKVAMPLGAMLNSIQKIDAALRSAPINEEGEIRTAH
jgi:hypothetical protein